MSVAICEPETPVARPRSGDVLLTVIIPVYNEAGTIDRLLKRVVAVSCQKQIILVDDGSTDQTPLILDRWQRLPGVEIFHHPQNRGKGAAIRTALEKARG